MKRWLLLALIACGIAFQGCGSSPDPAAAEAAALAEAAEASAPVEPAGPWKVRLTIDGEQGKPDANGLYCVFDQAVSTNPLVSFTLDDALGRFESAVVTIREVINGVVALDGIFISDFAAAEEYRLRPGRPFLLLNPGPGVIVGKGESVDIRRLKAGCTYQIDLVVQGNEGHETLPARFTTR
jgi:hypothetical protein